MENKKEERCAVYKTKAFHEQKEKTERQSAKNLGELAGIQDMNVEELINFLNNKYDKIICKNEQIYLPLSQAILQRIATIKSDLILNAKLQLKYFLLSGSATLTEEQQENLFNGGHLYNINKNKNMKGVKMMERRTQNLRFVSVSIRIATQAEEQKLFFCGKLPVDCQAEIDIKRFKKDALQVLEAIASFKAKVFTTSNQQL